MDKWVVRGVREGEREAGKDEVDRGSKGGW